MKKALIIIDYVYDFVAPKGNLTCGKPGQKIENHIVSLIKKFKESGDFIIEASDNHDINDEYNVEKPLFPAHCYDEQGQRLYGKVYDEVMSVSKPQYLKVSKSRYSAFCATDLDLKLRERGVNEVHLVGVCTDICVLHTAVEAYNLGYKIVVHKDGVATFNQDAGAFALEHMKNVIAATVI